MTTTLKSHATRFIIEFYLVVSKKWERSGNKDLSGHFPTRELAVEALAKSDTHHDMKYRVRQK